MQHITRMTIDVSRCSRWKLVNVIELPVGGWAACGGPTRKGGVMKTHSKALDKSFYGW